MTVVRSVSLPPLPGEFRATVERLRDHLPHVLGTNLVGIYLYGSVFDASFVSGRSDLDCLVVTHNALDPGEFDRLEAWLGSARSQDSGFGRIQMSLLVRDRVLEDDPSACLYQFGSLSRSGSDGNPIVWLDFLQRGFVLHGSHPDMFLPRIGPDVLHAALVREVAYLRDEISIKKESRWRDLESYRAYVVLTLCRILYSMATGRVTSKATAAEWALQTTPDEPTLRDLIRVAERVSNETLKASIPLPSVERFIGHVESCVTSQRKTT